MTAATRYRPDIDGLRAVAILPVVLFHARVPYVTGGYVGVDVFYVISGFLITRLIAAEIDRGTFSLTTFYERRIRRIFPALFVVLAASAAAAWVVLPPSAMHDFAKSLVAATAFVSNVLFFREADYFDAPAHLKPLLHTWSLAVEEQFYIVFPLFLMALHRLRVPPRALIAVIAVIALASLVACVVMTGENLVVGRQEGQAAAFYLAPFRAWELAVGALLALGAFPRFAASAGGRLAREIAGVAGVALILFAVFAFDERTAFPGIAALAPVAGAALVIHAASGADARPLVGRLLALAPLVFVGLISYSLYLWHWPMLLFVRFWSTETLTGVQTAGVVAASFACAIVSWRVVEQPVRRRAVFRGRGRLFAAAAAGSVAFVGFSYATHVTKGWPERVSPMARALDGARTDYNHDRDTCHSDDNRLVPFGQCVYGAQVARARPTVAIWGDSFAAEPAVALGEEAERKGQALLYVSHSNCLPALGIFPDRPGCEKNNRETLRRLSDPASTVRKVILVACYEAYTPLIPGALDAFAAVATALADAGKDVIVVWPIPRPPTYVPLYLARLAERGADPRAPAVELQRYNAVNGETVAYLERWLARAQAERDGRPESARRGRILPARVDALLCAGGRCPLMVDDTVLYWDDYHLSVKGARHALPAFAGVFD